ncbi:MAG: 50S ribosomal protein L17 [Candidatus Colwellbacteria bacterium]|nr:50S ribosomal protein L17 [Candidatus Colwellbacteria bacterium]
MNKAKKGRTFGRKRDARKAFLRSLMRALLLEEKITTTQARAKELRPLIEKLVTKGKKPSVETLRYLRRHVSPDIAKKVTGEISPRYESRPGGYTRIIKLASRRGDGAEMAVIEFV